MTQEGFKLNSMYCRILHYGKAAEGRVIKTDMDVRDISVQYLLDVTRDVRVLDWCEHQEFRYLSREYFDNNPYLRRIRLARDQHLNGVALRNDEGGVSVGVADVHLSCNKYGSRNTIVFADSPVTPVLTDSDGRSVWMSITPNEIFTMAAPIEKATGNVLVFGLGLGYYQYMVHLKENVRQVTIVEINSDIIELFEKNILPQFDHPEKIKIIYANAFDFISSNDLSAYDTIFVDIWKNAVDGVEVYLEMLARGLIGVRVHYWIEESILGNLRDQMNKHLSYAGDYTDWRAVRSADIFVALAYDGLTAIRIGKLLSE